MSRINFITFKMPQHAGHSGYAQLTRYIDGRKFDIEEPPWISKIIPSFLKKRFVSRSGLAWYGAPQFVMECNIILRMLKEKNKIFHFIYGENSFRYCGGFGRFRGHKRIATYHLPPELFGQYVRYTGHLSRLDAIICVASYQVDFFARFVPKDRVVFIPHGIDTDFFKSSDSKAKTERLCLFVGHMSRDFEVMREVARIVGSKDKRVKFLVVTRKEHFDYFRGIENVILKTGLNDEELLRSYQQATLLILPMRYCTANNSILEAMACGLPIITTDIGGIRDYLDDNCSLLLPPGKACLMADKVLELLNSKTRLEELSYRARKKALEFSWPNITGRIEKFYHDI